MEQIQQILRNPIVKVSLITVATAVKFYTPDDVDQLIDNALLVFLGYHAMSGSDNKQNG